MSAEIVVGIIGAVLALAGALGIAYAVFRSATVTKTLELYKGENEALGKAVARQQADILSLTTKVEELEKANQVLRETVSGREAINALDHRLSKYQEARKGEHDTMMRLLDEMKDTMTDLWQAVVRWLGEHS